jgi:hypothetical protein
MSTKILGIFVLLTWLSQVFYLYPLPQQAVSTFVANQERAFDAGLAVTGKSESKEAYLDRMRDLASREVWLGWAESLVTISFGVLAGLSLIRRWRISVYVLLLSSALYVATWWLFSGYLNTEVSLTDLFPALWKAAVAGHRELVFLHKDVVLLAIYHLLAIVAAVWLVQGIGNQNRHSVTGPTGG